MAEDLKIGLDDKPMLEAIKRLQEATKALAEAMEKSLGKDAVKAVEDLDKAAEQGTASISSRFKDLGKSILENMKIASSAGSLIAGLKIGESFVQGAKEVFNLERAFDRLNTRLQLTGRTFQDFKNNIGKSVAATGQKLEDIFPGVETASAKGGVKSPKELADIATVLAKARTATGEGTGALSDTVIQILQNQGKEINAKTFQDTLNVLQGTRVAGAFHTATDAGQAIEAITKGIRKEDLQKMGLGTRELGGLAAQSSKGGAGATDVLQHILMTATKAGGEGQLNSIFGTDIFKNGKLDVGAFSKANKDRFGQHSAQVMSEATGTDQAGLSRFLDSMKSSQENLKKVTDGSDETGKQYEIASDNLATKADKYKQSLVNATRSVADGFSSAVNEMIKGNKEGAIDDLKKAGQSAWENKGSLASGAALATLGTILTGGGIKGLGKFFSGAIGTAEGVSEGKALEKASGVTPVFVVNASEIGGKGGLVDSALNVAKVGGIAALATTAATAAAVIVAGGTAAAAGSNLEGLERGGEGVLDYLKNTLMGPNSKPVDANTPIPAGLPGSPDEMKKAVADGTVEGHQRVNKNKPVQMINPSTPTGRTANQ